MNESKKSEQTLLIELLEHLESEEDFPFMVTRNLVLVARNITNNKEEIIEFVEQAEIKIKNTREQMAQNGNDITDKELSHEQKRELLHSTITKFLKNNNINTKIATLVGTFQYNCNNARFANKVIRLLEELNENIVAKHNFYIGLSNLLALIEQQYNIYQEYSETLKTLININKEHKKLIHLKSPLSIFVENAFYLLDKKKNITINTFTYISLMRNRYFIHKEPFRELLIKILCLSKHSIKNI